MGADNRLRRRKQLPDPSSTLGASMLCILWEILDSERVHEESCKRLRAANAELTKRLNALQKRNTALENMLRYCRENHE